MSWRDDSRFGDRKTVKIQSDTPDLSTIDMEKLKAADEVAYVRFASVYREFKDVNTFLSELKKMLDK